MSTKTSSYNKYLLFIAGLGGLLYGIDVGVIAGALPYLEATTSYSPGQLSTVVAAVLLGSVFSSLFAGALSDLFGRKKIMLLAGICFVLSVPVICIPSAFETLVLGRILQGMAAGLIGVVVPLYLAECLTADKRGSGTGMFQFMLTIGLVFAAAVGVYFSKHVEGVIEIGGNVKDAKEFAWQAIFWVCAVPGVIFTLGALFISESPRWLFSKGAKSAALKALERSRGAEAAKVEFDEMEAVAGTSTDGDCEATGTEKSAGTPKESLFKKKYVIPFVIAVVILACNQATGINSVLAYIVNILNQAGLPGSIANEGDLAVKVLNCLMTIVAMILVDRKGRKFLLTLGTSGIIVGLIGVAAMFKISESDMAEKPSTPLALSTPVSAETAAKAFEAEFLKYSQGVSLEDIKVDEAVEKAADTKKDPLEESLDKNLALATLFTPAKVLEIATGKPSDIAINDKNFAPQQLKVVYKYGNVSGMKTLVVRPFDKAPVAADAPEQDKKRYARQLKTYLEELQLNVSQHKLYQDNKDSVIGEFFRKIHLNPFPNPAAINDGGFVIEKVEVGPVPSETSGWIVTLFFAIFISSFAVGPGVCVWLALSELMPTRIRSNGMSIALLINQFVSTCIAGAFLPVVGNYGYSTIFFFCAGCTVIYWITAVFFLPETKGRTLEEIEAHFDGTKKLK